GQRGEDRRVRVGGKLDGDLLVQCRDLLAQAGQGDYQGQGDFRAGGGLVAGGAPRRVTQVGPEPVKGGQMVVVLGAQPVTQPGCGEPVSLVLAGESAQERQGDVAVQIAEQPKRCACWDIRCGRSCHRLETGGGQVRGDGGPLARLGSSL